MSYHPSSVLGPFARLLVFLGVGIIINKDVDKDSELKGHIQFEYRRLKGIYGYRRMQTLLRRKHRIKVNRKRVY